MNIILVSGKLAKAKTITVGLPSVALAGTGVMLLIVLLAMLLHYAVLRFSSELKLPYLSFLEAPSPEHTGGEDPSFLRENLKAIAVRVGQMQAQLLRLDALGERLARFAGLKPQDLRFDEAPAQGGAVSTVPSHDLSLAEIGRQIDALTQQLDERGDRLGILDSFFTLDRAKRQLVPTMLPVEGGWYSSSYGWRIDPFTGQRAFHEGVDFMAEKGTPIRAAAGGVVVYSGYHPQYGNMVEIDHGNGLVTRYAHASKLLVKVGDVVLRGTRIAEVGKTGRATGAHLHFEVRRRGAPQNPAKFLRLPG